MGKGEAEGGEGKAERGRRGMRRGDGEAEGGGKRWGNWERGFENAGKAERE